MKKYRASGRVPFGGLIAMLLGTIIASLAVGGLAFAVSHLIYLIVFFPLVMGFLGGGILAFVVKRTKVRSPILAALFGLIMGVGIIGTVHFLDYYITDRNDYREAVYGKSAQDVPQEQVDKDMNDFLMEQTGSDGFIGDLKFNASLGITITPTSSSSSSSPMELDEKGTIIYWSIELLVVMLICAGVAFSAARQPFNEEADEWYPVPRYVGSVDWKSRTEFLSLIKNGDTKQVFQMISKNTRTAHDNLIDKSTRSFSIGDFISFACAMIMAIAFLLMPWLEILGIGMTAIRLFSEVQSSIQNDVSMLFLIPVAAILGALAGFVGLVNAQSRNLSRVIALIAGLVGLGYYILFFIQNSENSIDATGLVGSGFWVALFATLGLILQVFIPRSSSSKSTARLDLVAYQTPSAPNSDIILGINSVRLNRNREISSQIMKVLLTPEEFADLNSMVTGAQVAQPSVVQFSGAGGSLE